MSSTDLGDVGRAGDAGGIADKRSGNGLAGSQGQAGCASGKTSGGCQMSLEHIVGESRAGDRSIGARDSPEHRAGNRVSV
jgi:hypothetical protein